MSWLELWNPRLVYSHECYNCRVPPAEVCLPVQFVGSFFWGGLSPALHVGWLRWRRVTHALNCMGSIDPWTGNTEPSYALALAGRSPDIRYIDWCITHSASRKQHEAVFSQLERILKCPGSCLYGLLCSSELAGTGGLWQGCGTSIIFWLGSMRFCTNELLSFFDGLVQAHKLL